MGKLDHTLGRRAGLPVGDPARRLFCLASVITALRPETRLFYGIFQCLARMLMSPSVRRITCQQTLFRLENCHAEISR